jgi:hypothetical protein
MNLFSSVGRYFWLLCLGLSAYRYVVGIRSIATMGPSDPRASPAAIALRRWFALVSALPWVVMGWAILIGGVPNIWYFFRPQDRNPYVWVWFATLFAIAFGFAFWVFILAGAEKVALLQPVELKWYRTGWRGTTRGTFELTAVRVKLLAAMGPIWIAAWIWLVSSMNTPLPK